MNAAEVFNGSDAALTRRYHAALLERGAIGKIAMHLLRAQKASLRAKKYHGGIPGKGSYSKMAYDRKCESLRELSLILIDHAEAYHIRWGWGTDDKQAHARYVLYIELPMGQVSYHSPTQFSGPKFEGGWDGMNASQQRVLAFCEHVMAMQTNHENAMDLFHALKGAR